MATYRYTSTVQRGVRARSLPSESDFFSDKIIICGSSDHHVLEKDDAVIFDASKEAFSEPSQVVKTEDYSTINMGIISQIGHISLASEAFVKSI